MEARTLMREGGRWIIPLLLLVTAPLGAQPPEGGRAELGLPFLRNFSPKAYGAETQNWAFAQDARGVIYVANTGGVLEFDGLRWRLIPIGNETIVRTLAVDAAGRVYVGAHGDLGYLEPDAAGWTRYVSLLERIPQDARSFTDVWRIFPTPEGVYFTTFQRIFRLRGDEVRVWNPETTFHLSFRVRDRLFVRALDRGLMEMREGRLAPVPGGERFAQERIYGMLPWGADGAGAILVASRTQGLFVLDGESLRPFPTEVDADLARDLIYGAARMADGGVAFGTVQGGVYVLDQRGRLVSRIRNAGGLQDDTVYTLFPDRQGGVWLGLGRGLARVEAGGPITRFDERAGLPGEVIAVHRHRDRLYACSGQGLFRLAPGPEPRFERVAGLRGQTWSLASVGETLLAANADGLYEVREASAVQVLNLNRPFAVSASKAAPGRVFVGMIDGVASLRREGGRWVNEGNVPGVAGEVRTFLEMPDGRLWVGTRKGIHRVTFSEDGMRGSRVEPFGTAEGLPHESDNRVFPVGGEALFATQAGVFRFDEGRGRFAADPRFSTLFPEGPRRLWSLAEDRQGRVWISSVDDARGLKEAGAAVRQPDGSWRWDPTPLRPFLGAWTETIHVDDDGVLWFGGDDGVFRYDPRVQKDYAQRFTAVVRQVSHAGGGEALFGGAGPPAAPAVDYSRNALRFEYAAPSFDSMEATRFQVLLEGYDTDWSPWTAEGYREYTNLREGGYRFRVRAKNLYGVLSEEGVYDFRVRPPWYRTVWAYLAYLLAAAALGWLLVRWRLRSVEAEKRELEATVAARTAELHNRNAQLETLNAIVKSINERLDFDELLDAMLRECRVIRGVEKAAALVRLPGTAVFTFRAALGWTRAQLQGIELDLAEAEARYTVDAEEVSEDIFLIRGGENRAAEAKLRLETIPRALLAVRIRVEGEVEGYLVFENQQHEQAFDEHDLDLLRGLREHFVSAFQKARARAATEEARARAEEASRAKSQFLANMSHELRTPLNAIIGYSEMLEEQAQDLAQPTLVPDLERIRGSGRHLLALIDEILDLSKVEAGKVTLLPETFAVKALVDGVVTMVRPLVEKNGNVLEVRCAEGLPDTYNDPTRVRQILFNLLSNACKFTRAGTITLDVRRDGAPGMLRFEVRDTGIGMTPEQLGRIFQAFSQAEATTSRKFGGTGLGLVISLRFAQLMGGTITVESAAGEGTTFTAIVPASIRDPRDKQERAAAS